MTELRAYRFAHPKQWARCITHRFDESPGGGILPAPRLGDHAVHAPGTASTGGVPPAAVDRHGVPVWLIDSSGPLWQSPRLALDDEWIWAFERGGTVLSRFDRESLQPDTSVDLKEEVLDIASDGRDGVWVLTGGFVTRFDCEGRRRERHPLPCEAEGAVQIGTSGRGKRVVFLTADRRRLVFLHGESGAVDVVRVLGQLAPCWTAAQLASDARNRIVLWGRQTNSQARWLLFVLDGSGDTIDGPIAVTFLDPSGASPSGSLETVRVAVHRQTVWFATDAGLWRLDPGEAAGRRESESTLLTRALLSPDSGTIRGWLRAEVSMDLPPGAGLEAQVVTTDDPHLVEAAEVIAEDRALTSEQKQAAIWALFNPSEIRTTVFGPSAAKDVPFAIPVLEERARWLWLRLSILTPPGATPAPLRELRVMYPNASIIEHLPGAFRGEQNDPTGALRKIVGVLEATTQRFDERIRGIASFLDPSTAPEKWLDYLARWMGLPWDDALPEESKRGLLGRAGEILDRRGTRAGLLALLQALAGGAATVDITDVTVDYAPMRLGRVALPALVAGSPGGTPSLGAKAVLGRARLCGDPGPMASLTPVVRVRVAAGRDARRALAPVLTRVLAQYIPAGVALSIKWLTPGAGALEPLGDAGFVIEDSGPGRVGQTAALGTTAVGGRRGSRLDEGGLEVGFRLR